MARWESPGRDPWDAVREPIDADEDETIDWPKLIAQAIGAALLVWFLVFLVLAALAEVVDKAVGGAQ